MAKNTDIGKMAENCTSCIKCLSHPAPHKPYGVGARKQFFG